MSRWCGGGGISDLPRAYVRCTRFPHPGFDRWAQRAAETPGWGHRSLDCGHVAHVSEPDAVAGVLLDLVGSDR